MSWDIVIQDVPRDAKSVAEIPHDFEPEALGPRADLIAQIQEVLPDVDFSEPAWGTLDRPGFSIEFNMGDDEICDGFMLHVRGGGSAVATIAQLLQHLQLRALDCQAGDFFSIEAAENSFRRWQTYRDKVVGGSGENPSG